MSEQLIATPGTFGDNGNFLLERELGQGGMGGVYMGRDKMLDRPVAVKIMLKELGSDAEFVEKFKKEAQSAAKLIHPNIAQIYSYGISDGMPYIAMELVAGGSLYAIIQNAPGKADIQRVLKICQQVAQALQCASDQGFVHGDVKPENILLDANGNAKLVDFGLAAMQKDTDEIWGTPYYISPEKVKKEPVDFRADMYSLGGTLYHALTGVAPFEGEDSIAVVKKRFEGLPKKPSEIRPEITPAIDHLVMKMLAHGKEERYPSFEALIEAFKEVLTSGLSTQTQAVPAQPRTTTVRTSPNGTRRMTVRGRRTAMMRRPSAASAVSPETGTEEDDKKKSADEEDEEESGGNLGVKVILFIVGGILAIAAVVGGLVWYKVADEKARAAEEQRQIAANIGKAREAIADTRKATEKFDGDFADFTKNATKECQRLTDELKKLLPDFANDFKPAPSAELLAAMASTNAPGAAPSGTAGLDAKWRNLDGAHLISGTLLSESDLANKAVVVVFWNIKDAASCAMLSDIQEKVIKPFVGKPFLVIGSHSSKQGTRDEAKAIAAMAKLTFSVYEDMGARYGEPQGMAGKLPYLYIVDPTGKFRYQGQDLHAMEGALTTVVTELTAKAAPAASATAAPAKTNATAQASAPSAAKAEAAKVQTPVAVTDMHDLWERAYSCQASQIKIHLLAVKALAECDKVNDIKDDTEASMKALAELSITVKDLYDQLVADKNVENVRKSIGLIKSKGIKIVDQTVKRLRLEKLEADRKAKREAQEAAEKARLEKQAEEKKAKIEEESKTIETVFETLVAQGTVRQLDWKGAIRQLETAKGDFTTAEGQLAADLQIRKINAMKKTHDIFIRKMKGHKFRGKLKGGVVASVNDHEIEITKPNGKGKIKILWQKFYKDYPGNLNELFNTFIIPARKSGALNLKDWSEAMTGAALTMQLVCAEVNGATEKAEALVKQTVAEFPDYQETAAKIFPSITLGEEEGAETTEEKPDEKSDAQSAEKKE